MFHAPSLKPVKSIVVTADFAGGIALRSDKTQTERRGEADKGVERNIKACGEAGKEEKVLNMQ